MAAGILKIRLDLLMIKGKTSSNQRSTGHVAHEDILSEKVPRQTGSRQPWRHDPGVHVIWKINPKSPIFSFFFFFLEALPPALG
jgi:hypothetical protein